MSINIRPFRSGGWEVDIVITYPNGDKFRERRKAPVDTKSSARRWAQERERHLLQHGRPPRRGEKINPDQEAPPVPTLAEFVPRYLEHIKANRQKPSTRHTKHLICRNHLIPQFGGGRLDTIDEHAVQRLKVALADYSPKTVNNVLTVLNTVLQTAVTLGVLAEVPVKAKWVKVTQPSMPFYDFEEYDRLRDSARRVGPRHELVVLLAGDAGLRCGEIRALRWTSIDFTRGLLTVERAFSLHEVLPPKGDRIRTVPMTRRLTASLAAMRASLPEGTVHVLTTNDEMDRPPDQATIRKWLHRAQRDAGVMLKGPHTLRHTFCSQLAMTGAHVMEIKTLAGHAELETTQRYMHLTPRALRGAVDRLEGSAVRGFGDDEETRKRPSPNPE